MSNLETAVQDFMAANTRLLNVLPKQVNWTFYDLNYQIELNPIIVYQALEHNFNLLFHFDRIGETKNGLAISGDRLEQARDFAQKPGYDTVTPPKIDGFRDAMHCLTIKSDRLFEVKPTTPVFAIGLDEISDEVPLKKFHNAFAYTYQLLANFHRNPYLYYRSGMECFEAGKSEFESSEKIRLYQLGISQLTFASRLNPRDSVIFRNLGYRLLEFSEAAFGCLNRDYRIQALSAFRSAQRLQPTEEVKEEIRRLASD